MLNLCTLYQFFTHNTHAHSSHMRAHTHTHARTHTHLHLHVLTHVHKNTDKQTHTHTFTYTYSHTRIQTQTNTHIQTFIFKMRLCRKIGVFASKRVYWVSLILRKLVNCLYLSCYCYIIMYWYFILLSISYINMLNSSEECLFVYNSSVNECHAFMQRALTNVSYVNL